MRSEKYAQNSLIVLSNRQEGLKPTPVVKLKA